MTARSLDFLSPVSPAPDGFEQWIERWGGWMVAGFLHLALLAVLANQALPVSGTKPPPPIIVRFELPPPPPPPPPPMEARIAPPIFRETVATTTAPEDREANETARVLSAARSDLLDDPAEETADPATPLEPLAPADPAHVVLSAAAERQIEFEYQQLVRERVLQEIEQNRMRTEVSKLEVEAKGRRFLFESDGGLQGAIRTLDISPVIPEDIVEKVFRTYHIRVRRNAPPSTERSPSFLNAAVTREGTFSNLPPAGGPQDVFTLSPTAMNALSRLETQALDERGFNPRYTRVLEIRFGIVKNTEGEWDLGVTHLQTEAIP